MRTVLTAVIAAAGLVGAAQAQAPAPATPPTPNAAPAATGPAPSAPAPATTAPMAPTTAAPAAGAPAPATGAPAEAAPPAAAEPAPPQLPTTGDGATIIHALETICVPAVRGQGIDKAAKAAGLRQNRRDGTWTMPLGGAKDYVLIFQPQFSQTDVCQAEVHYATGQDQPIVQALVVWTYLHKPELILQANYVAVDADGVKRVRKSWEHLESNGASTAVNFSTWSKPDGTPLNPRYDTGMLFYQERKGS
jgi:hypothetical protein